VHWGHLIPHVVHLLIRLIGVARPLRGVVGPLGSSMDAQNKT